MLGLAFAILNVRHALKWNFHISRYSSTDYSLGPKSWTALSASLNLSLPSGGCVSVVWGTDYNVHVVSFWRLDHMLTFPFLLAIRNDNRGILYSVHGYFIGRISISLSYVRFLHPCLLQCMGYVDWPANRAGGQYHWVAGKMSHCANVSPSHLLTLRLDSQYVYIHEQGEGNTYAENRNKFPGRVGCLYYPFGQDGSIALVGWELQIIPVF